MVFFGLAFGNRTELAFVLPIYVYLWLADRGNTNAAGSNNMTQRLREKAPALIRFLGVTVTLALITAAYNLARFHSVFDFGYSHIPKLLKEPYVMEIPEAGNSLIHLRLTEWRGS